MFKYVFMEDIVRKTILDNYKTKSDQDIAKLLRMSPTTIRRYRKELNINSRFLRQEETDMNVLGTIMEMFVSDIPMQSIARLFKKSNSTISILITRHYFCKKLSEKTKVVTLQSKINNT